jgi:RHS repeat-associated protein
MVERRRARGACFGTLLLGMAAVLACDGAANAQELVLSEVFNAGVAFGTLAEASADSSGPIPPFVTLATPVSVNPQFGTANATIPIEVPPGRNGMTPNVDLRYSSNAANGLFGVGWSLGLGVVERSTSHGVPLDYTTGLYADAFGFQLSFRGGSILLDTCVDPPSCNTWAPSAEEVWLSPVFDRTNNRWQIKDLDGVTWTYGGARPARTGTNVDSAGATFSWHLTGAVDANGNAIEVEYRDVVFQSGWNPSVEPGRIDYGGNAVAGLPHVFHIEFGYESRAEFVEAYRTGSLQYLVARVSEIAVSVDTAATNPIRTYHFEYQEEWPRRWSLLTSVSLTGNDAATPTPPPTTFTYSVTTDHSFRLSSGAPLRFAPNVPPGLTSSQSTSNGTRSGFFDVDGDGLPDFLDGMSNSSGMELYRNQGGLSFVKEPEVWTAELRGSGGGSWIVSGADQLRLIDMDGDGLPDIVKAPASCYPPYPPTATCTWQVLRNISDPGLRQGRLQTANGWWHGAPFGAPLVSGTSTVLLDLNGDGLPDVLHCPAWSAASPYCDFYRNLGGGSDPNTGGFAAKVPWSVPVANDCTNCGESVGPLAAMGSGGVSKQVFDINGDGLPDLVSSRPEWNVRTCSLAIGAMTCTSDSQCTGNGRCAAHWDVFPNTGRGFRPQPIFWHAPSPSSTSPPYRIEERNGSGLHRAVRDLNGDGLPDYVDDDVRPTFSTNWKVYVNNGRNFTGLPGYTVWDTQSFVNLNGLIDFSGDGAADYAYYESNQVHALLGNMTGRPRLVAQHNGLGASISVRYRQTSEWRGGGCIGGVSAGSPCLDDNECPGGTCAASCPGCSQLPFPIPVVAAIMYETSGSIGGPTEQFIFSGPYFDRRARQFRGFRQSEVRGIDAGGSSCFSHDDSCRSAPQVRTVRRFAPPPFAASAAPAAPSMPSRSFQLVEERQLDGAGMLFAKTTTDWETATVGTGRVQIRPSKHVDTIFSTDGSAPKRRTQTFNAYDPFNGVKSTTVSGDDVPPVTTTTEYLWEGCSGLGCLALLCPGLPTKIVVTDHTGLALSESDFAYDNKCNLRKLQARLAANGQAATGGQLITRKELQYDLTVDSAAAKAGLPTRILDARGAAANPQYGTTLQYGCSNGLYPCTITNPLQQTTSITYDPRWGKPTSIMDENGSMSRTMFEYDGLGRLTRVFRPLDPFPWREYAYMFGRVGNTPYSYSVPSSTTTKIREPNAPTGYRTLVTFFDDWGRQLETKQDQYVDGRRTVVATGAVVFDALGRISKRFASFIAPTQNLMTYDKPSSTAAATRFSYDLWSRVVQIMNPDRTYRTFDHRVAGQTAVKDENYTKGSYPGEMRMEHRDALGRTAAVFRYTKDPGRSDVLATVTTRDYDGLGRLIAATVSDGQSGRSARSAFSYDSFDRLTHMMDPDSGLWQFGYDAAGNLVSRDDPRSNQRVAACYDRLNRVTREAYLSDSSSLVCPPQVTTASRSDYVYDTGVGGKGRLAAVTDHRIAAAGAATNAVIYTAFSYDGRGRVDGEHREIELPDFGQFNAYSHAYSYDVADRLAGITYPTGLSGPIEDLAYTYDDVGQLHGISSPRRTYATELTYDLFGRLTSWRDGSGLQNAAIYDSTGKRNFRLQELSVRNPSASSAAGWYRRFVYSRYDSTGNLITVRDKSKYSSAVLKNTWQYGYDGLGRLTYAKKGRSTVHFGFDGLGNMTAGNGLSFTYIDPGPPHHLGTVGDLFGTDTAVYDANGALAGVPRTGTTPSRTVTYDRAGHVERVRNDETGASTYSIFDFRGERVARIVDGTIPAVTSYFGRWFDIAGTTVTRHIYMGDQLIAESPVEAATAQAPPAYFVHADHLGSTTMLTCSSVPGCADRSVSRHFRYDASGQVSSYSALGVPVPPAEQKTERLFTGKTWDGDAGLYFYGARFYDPKLAVFLTLDPIRASDNPYGYAQGNPVNRIDPTALQDCRADARVCVVIEGPVGGGNPYVPGGSAGPRNPFVGSGRHPGVPNVSGPIFGPGVPFPSWQPRSPRPVFQGIPLHPIGEGGRPYDDQNPHEVLAFDDPGLESPLLDPVDIFVGGGVAGAAAGAGRGLFGRLLARLGVGSTAGSRTTTVIGRTTTLKNLARGERSLLDRLTPDLGSPRANWGRNSGVLRSEMRRGLPIRDASPGDSGGIFLNAERALLKERGWTFDPRTSYWMPPRP